MKEVTKYESDDGQLFDTPDEAFERDEQLEIASFLEKSDLMFFEVCSPLVIIQELQKRYIITKKEPQPLSQQS